MRVLVISLLGVTIATTLSACPLLAPLLAPPPARGRLAEIQYWSSCRRTLCSGFRTAGIRVASFDDPQTPTPTCPCGPGSRCTLRDAVAVANECSRYLAPTGAAASSEASRIVIALAAGTYTLDHPEQSDPLDPPSELGSSALTITGGVIIRSASPDSTIMRPAAASAFRLVRVSPGAYLSLEGVHLSGGSVSPDHEYGGGAIFNDGELQIQHCELISNVALRGGAIDNRGTLTINESTIWFNVAEDSPDRANSQGRRQGGGLMHRGPGHGTVRRTHFMDNRAEYGGNIMNAGPLDIEDTTIQGGWAASDGGGIYIHSGDLTLTNVTLSANEAAEHGGAIHNFNGRLTLRHCTIADNITGERGSGAVMTDGQNAQIAIHNSLFANSGSNCSRLSLPGLPDRYHGSGVNLSTDASCPPGYFIRNRDPRLGRLTAIDASAPPTAIPQLRAYWPGRGGEAVDTGGPALNCDGRDARGGMRPVGRACDIGAIELDPLRD